MDQVFIESEPFNPWQRLQDYQQARFGDSAAYGAVSSFVGTMRDFNEGDDVTAMLLEHYPGMTDNFLQNIINEAMAKWDVIDCLIMHRVGSITPADTIMLTAVWSAHRREAFEAGRYLVEELKHRAPFWKKEILATGDARWVETNTPG